MSMEDYFRHLYSLRVEEDKPIEWKAPKSMYGLNYYVDVEFVEGVDFTSFLVDDDEITWYNGVE